MHSLSIKDFQGFVARNDMYPVRTFFLGHQAEVTRWPNLFAEHAVFVLERAR